jgi:hypothetical protein
VTISERVARAWKQLTTVPPDFSPTWEPIPLEEQKAVRSSRHRWRRGGHMCEHVGCVAPAVWKWEISDESDTYACAVHKDNFQWDGWLSRRRLRRSGSD